MKSCNFMWLVVLLFCCFNQSIYATSLGVDMIKFNPGKSTLRTLFDVGNKSAPNIYLLAVKANIGDRKNNLQLFHLSPQLKAIPHKKRLPLQQIQIPFNQKTEAIELFFFHSSVLDKTKQYRAKAASLFKTISLKDIIILDKKIRREITIPFEAFRLGDRILFQDFNHDFVVFGHYDLQPNQLTEQLEFVARPPYLADYRLQQAILDGLLVIELSVQN